MNAPDRHVQRRYVRPLSAALAALALAVGAVLVAPLSAQAATLTVTSDLDGGAGSLRAIAASAASGDTIVFDPSVTTIALASAVTLTKGITIDGGGTVTITRANNSNFGQLLGLPDTPDQDYVFAGLTIVGIPGSTGSGIATSIGAGNNLARDITLSNVTVSGQTAVYGGGFSVFNALGDILIENSTFQSNTSTSPNPGDGGGAVDLDNVQGTVTVLNTVFDSNESANTGGGLNVRQDGFAGALAVIDSTFESNVSALGGGGMFLEFVGPTSNVVIQGSTFSGNSIGGASTGVSMYAQEIRGFVVITNSTFDEPGSGAYPIASFVDDGVLAIEYSTITGGNGAVGFEAVAGNDGTAEITSSILSGGAVPAVVVDGVGSVLVSYSILSSALNSDITDDGGNQFSVADPKLGPLQNNGGPTLTRLPLAGSPAIDRGLPGTAPVDFDQRGTGFPRVIAGRVDVGAVETALALAATGATINFWIPIAAGILLFGGAAVIVTNVSRRRRLG